MDSRWHFPISILMSAVLYLVTLRVTLRRCSVQPARSTVFWVGAITVVAGMIFAKVGATFGLPVAVYYGTPAVVA